MKDQEEKRAENNSADSDNCDNEEKARKIVRVVESILEKNDKIREICRKQKNSALVDLDEDDEEDADEKQLFMLTGKKIVNYYTKRSSMSGGLSALPAAIPGIGSLATFLGGTLADVVLMLKFEVEMTLCLCHLAGFDIDNERDRQLAFTLASVSACQVMSGKNKTIEAASLVGAAFWDYSLRELSKYLITVIAKIICIQVSRGLVKAIPLLGAVVGASVNCVMTHRTGGTCLTVLWERKKLRKKAHVPTSNEVFDADFADDETKNETPENASAKSDKTEAKTAEKSADQNENGEVFDADFDEN